MVMLREDIRRVRTQVMTVCSRTSSSRPPEANCGAFVHVAIRAIVAARTEKVKETNLNEPIRKLPLYYHTISFLSRVLFDK